MILHDTRQIRALLLIIRILSLLESKKILIFRFVIFSNSIVPIMKCNRLQVHISFVQVQSKGPTKRKSDNGTKGRDSINNDLRLSFLLLDPSSHFDLI